MFRLPFLALLLFFSCIVCAERPLGNLDDLLQQVVAKNHLKYDYYDNLERISRQQLDQLSNTQTFTSGQKASYGHNEDNSYLVSGTYKSSQSLVDVRFDTQDEREGSASFLWSIASSQQRKINSLQTINRQESTVHDLARDNLLLQETKQALAYIVKAWAAQDALAAHGEAARTADSLLKHLSPLTANGLISTSLLFSLETFSLEQRLAVEQLDADVVIAQLQLAEFLRAEFTPGFIVPAGFIQHLDSLVPRRQSFAQVPYSFSIDSLNLEIQRKQYTYASMSNAHLYLGPNAQYDYTDDSYNLGVRAYFECTFPSGSPLEKMPTPLGMVRRGKNVTPSRISPRFTAQSESYLQVINAQIVEILRQTQLGYYQSLPQLATLLEKKLKMGTEQIARRADTYYDTLESINRLTDLVIP
jgi:hypothetical protein